MDEQGKTATKTTSWATVLVIAGAAFFVIGLVSHTPAVYLIALTLIGAGAVTQFVTDRRRP